MKPECIVYESGGGFGGVEEIKQGSLASASPFDQSEMGTINAVPTKEEKEFFMKKQGIPVTKSPEKADESTSQS
jgi:hypothetical protein